MTAPPEGFIFLATYSRDTLAAVWPHLVKNHGRDNLWTRADAHGRQTTVYKRS